MTFKTVQIKGDVELITNYGSDEEAEYEPVHLAEFTRVDWDTCTGIAWETTGERVFCLAISTNYEVAGDAS